MRRRTPSATAGRAASDEPMIVGPSRGEVRAAVESLSAEMTWDELAPGLRPMFMRRRPMPPGAAAPLTFRLRPGLDVCLGVDIGPAFLYVGPEMLADWPVTADDALERAIANLRASLASERYVEIEYTEIADVPFWCYGSRGGLASALLLLEDELCLRYGDEPRLLIAPMRNLLLAAPFDADRDLVGWLRDEISFEDPNGLDLPIFALLEGRLSVDRRQSHHGRQTHGRGVVH